ncbi:hypothetical protein K227x_06970 [Rubripirellula lacrimiformis]|uniref:Stigma-specific protein, Stig1 n=1 Tax=Rubripirellula lacrimiformis TaxID=1930273 RepID=A0A517N5D0_9BACT|nr:hypothetical protein K227x_06970 [Rubripirellula lacrimiformis]
MKRTIMTLTMVLGCTLCTQSFGFDLLDRMLGIKGCGSAASCCDTGCDIPSCAVEPNCGCEAPSCDTGCNSCDKGCGLLGKLHAKSCLSEPNCGCEAPACGCEVPSCDTGCNSCDKGCGLLGKLHAKSCLSEPTCGCEAPTCGCEAPAPCGCESVPSCDSGCGCSTKKCGLLSKMFSCNKGCDAGCDSSCGGCAIEPSCGFEVASCDSGCGCSAPKCKIGNGQLLSRLFGNLGHKGCGCDSGCDAGCGCSAEPTCGIDAPCGCSAPASSCGCSGGMQSAPVAAPHMDAAPMPPAPIVDPSASVTQKRRVVQASAVFTR